MAELLMIFIPVFLVVMFASGVSHDMRKREKERKRLYNRHYWVISQNWPNSDEPVRWTWYPSISAAYTAADNLTELYTPLRTFWVEGDTPRKLPTKVQAKPATIVEMVSNEFRADKSAQFVDGSTPRYRIYIPCGVIGGRVVAGYNDYEEAMRDLQTKYVGGTLV